MPAVGIAPMAYITNYYFINTGNMGILSFLKVATDLYELLRSY